MVIITINGTPGSGKSTFARLLAKRLNYKFYSVGDERRASAELRGITLAEFNKLGEGEEDTDTRFDQFQKKLAEKGESFVIDSRLGFFFIPKSIKIFLDADEEVRAERFLERESVGEHPHSITEAKRMNRERVQCDVRRYMTHYGVNPYDKQMFDIVLDSTTKSPNQLVDEVVERFSELFHHRR